MVSVVFDKIVREKSEGKEREMMSASEEVLNALEKGQMEEGMKQLHRALNDDSDDLLGELSEHLWEMGFLDEARQVLLTLRERQPQNDEWNVTLAEIAIENDDLDAAFDYLEQVAPTSKAYPESLLVLADLYQMIGIPEVSETKLKEVKQLLPNESLIDFALAELYFSLGDYHRASEQYQLLIQQGIEEEAGVSINARLGKALSMEGKFEDAIPYLEKAVDIDRSDDHLFELAYTYLQLEERGKAIQLLKELKELNPTYQSLYYFLAEALKEEERDAEALEVVKEGIEQDAFQARLFQLAAELSYRLHDVSAAEDYLKQAIELGDGVDESILALSQLYLSEERFEEAIDVLKQLEEVDGYAKWILAQAYRGMEEDEKALPLYKEANLEMGHDPDFMRDYGLYLREIGQMADSNEVLEHYLHHVPDDMEIQTLLNDDLL